MNGPPLAAPSFISSNRQRGIAPKWNDALVQMTDTFASTCGVTIPVLLLAAAVEARTAQERISEASRLFRDLIKTKSPDDPDGDTRKARARQRALSNSFRDATRRGPIWLALIAILCFGEFICLLDLTGSGPTLGVGVADALVVLVSISLSMIWLCMSPGFSLTAARSREQANVANELSSVLKLYEQKIAGIRAETAEYQAEAARLQGEMEEAQLEKSALEATLKLRSAEMKLAGSEQE